MLDRHGFVGKPLALPTIEAREARTRRFGGRVMKQSQIPTTKFGALAGRFLPVGLLIGGAALAIAALPAQRAAADDETHDTEIRITAPIDTTNCAATPATITVLGLSIDVSAAGFDVASSATATPTATPAATAADDGTRGHGSKSSRFPTTPGCYYYCPTPPPSSCPSLVAGQTVEVKLKSDSTPLVATEVSQNVSAANVAVQAPIQTINAATSELTILGLTVDVSGAGLAGSDDRDEASQPIDVSELIAGQFAEVQLTGATPPLVAAELEVKNFANQIDVSVEDSSGKRVEDVDAHGNAIDDVSVDVVQTVSVVSGAPAPAPTPLTYYGVPIGPAPAPTAPVSHESKHLRLRGTSNGRLTVSGLATGRAIIVITRVHGGVTTQARRAIAVKSNIHRSVHLRLQSRAR
jgi:hypothetical protein